MILFNIYLKYFFDRSGLDGELNFIKLMERKNNLLYSILKSDQIKKIRIESG